MNYLPSFKRCIKFSVALVVCSQILSNIAFANPLSEDNAVNNKPSGLIKNEVVDLYNGEKQRPVKVDLWFKDSECDKNNCKQTPSDKLNVAILSHGAMGSAKDYSWLAYPLAAKGWVVVGLNHYGESWRYGRQNIDPSSVMRFWQRTEDASFVIDSLAAVLPKHLTTKDVNIVVVGHSSGGYTAAALAGVTLDFTQMQNYCTSVNAKGDLGCSYANSDTPKQTTSAAPQNINFAFDSRVSGIVMLDPAMGPAATVTSLNKVNLPTLIIGSQQNDFLPFEYHAKSYANKIPKAELVSLNNGEGHFVYINVCDNNYKARGVSLCQDRVGVNRAQVQQQMVGQILKFVAKS